jgi:hypothetical protein
VEEDLLVQKLWLAINYVEQFQEEPKTVNGMMSLAQDQ